MKKKFSILLSGKGSVFGVKFRPGAFYPFCKQNISNLSNKTCVTKTILKSYNITLENKILSLQSDFEKIKYIENWLESILPDNDPNILIINQIIEKIKSHRSIQTVNQLAKIFTMSERKIQRLFHIYVGATPKWVIQRFRLHEAAERLEKANKINYADFALEMNYFDQSHFIKDFKKTIGLTPEEYQKSNV